ncbi:MAG: patatin-like phospholipase family protein [Nitrospirae bacterium]|nr:patatin-like phospholipase family protein [Nitrospirota bacterium]
MKALLFLGVMLSLLSTGCSARIHYLTPNTTGGPVFQPLEEPNTLVGLAISGGGSRAATFAAGALEALAEVRIKEGDREISLLEKVNYISSVSGGSLAGAYYAVKKPDRGVPILGDKGLSPRYQGFFSDYKADMQRNFQTPVLLRQIFFVRQFNPTKVAYSLSEVWDGAFFNEITFSGLYKREQHGDSPRLILNGTLYNNGRRFVLTTLSPADFNYDFTRLLGQAAQENQKGFPKDEQAGIAARIEKARKQLLPVTFEDIQGDHHELRISLAVATSASFPPVIGPVTYNVEGQPTYNHIGDGGLFDNLGLESLSEVFLNKITPGSAKKGLIIVMDASYPFDVKNDEMDHTRQGFQAFVDDPSRPVGIMEQRANAYQFALWNILRGEQVLLPDFNHFTIVFLKNTDADWAGYQDLPAECRGVFKPDVTPEKIRQAISQIPTLFKIKNRCHGALLIKAAHKVVEKHRDEIIKFLQSP